MVRAVCFLGLTGGFLAISPKLRDAVVETVNAASTGVEDHSPYSYVGLGVAALLVLMFYLSKGTSVR